MASYLESAVSIAREAGTLLLQFAERRPAFELKGEFDLVTAADRASEALILDRLRSRFPSHAILAEESGAHASSSDFRWYVDPLDGTTNFAHSFPMWNVTLALEQAGQMIAGVVYDPLRDEMFTAERGAGAYLNGDVYKRQPPNTSATIPDVRVKVLFFGPVKDITGRAADELELPPGSTLQSVFDHYAAPAPRLR